MIRRVRKVLPAVLALAVAACGSPAPRRRASAPPPPLAKAVVRTAKEFLPEEDKGRKTPKDCSDFVGTVYRENGMPLPRSSSGMAGVGEDVGRGELRMADLLFFSGSKGGRAVGHVGIYVNNGIFIHQANPGEGVRMESLYSDYYRRRYLRARRVID